MTALADEVRVLFSVFVAPYILNHMKTTLDSLHSAADLFDDGASTLHSILMNVLTTASKSFLYDENALFASKERILLLSPPVINQVCRASFV